MTQTAVTSSTEHEAEREAQAAAAAWQADADLAAAGGKTPEHTAARDRVARQFIEIHLPDTAPDQVDQILAGMDLAEPVQVVNAAGIDTSRPASRGLLGFGRRPQYLVGQRIKPQKPDDPVYALKSYPAK